MMDELIKGVGTLIGLIIFTLVREWWMKRETFKRKARAENSFSISAVEEINKQVTHEQKKILWKFSAMRMYVMHFTNGSRTEAGVSIKKMIFMHEVVQDYYIEPLAKYFAIEQPLPQRFLSPYRHCDRTDKFFLPDVEEAKKIAEEKLTGLEELKNDSNATLVVELEQKIEYYNWLLIYKVKSTLWVALKNKHGKMVAIQCIHFPKAHAINESNVLQIVDMTKSIEDIYKKHSIE